MIIMCSPIAEMLAVVTKNIQSIHSFVLIHGLGFGMYVFRTTL